MKKTTLITGISGQDGSFLSELLLDKGYDVWGILRRQSVAENQTRRLDHIFNRLHLVYGDMTDKASLLNAVQKVAPDEIYNLAAQSHVRISSDIPEYTLDTIGKGTLNLLETVKFLNPNIKIYQASSSECFGNSVDSDGFQRETTPMVPTSPYACAKVYAFNICRHYRKAYKMFVVNGILFNHESPRRGTNFVTNKVVKTAVQIKKGKKKKLTLGNLDASRDWGHAKDYMRAAWEMMQLKKADDFVCATGISHTVAELCQYVFVKLDLDWHSYVTIDRKYFRPEELTHLRGSSSKLRKCTGWKPQYTFETMIDEMIEHWMGEIQ